MARDPANVRSAEVDISRVVVKGILEGGGSVQHVASNGVQHPLGLTRAATGCRKESFASNSEL